jgi:hypothetical protein
LNEVFAVSPLLTQEFLLNNPTVSSSPDSFTNASILRSGFSID